MMGSYRRLQNRMAGAQHSFRNWTAMGNAMRADIPKLKVLQAFYEQSVTFPDTGLSLKSTLMFPPTYHSTPVRPTRRR